MSGEKLPTSAWLLSKISSQTINILKLDLKISFGLPKSVTNIPLICVNLMDQ